MQFKGFFFLFQASFSQIRVFVNDTGFRIPFSLLDALGENTIKSTDMVIKIYIYALEVQDQTKWLVFRMIHGSRIPDPTKGQAVWSTWTS